MGSNLYHEKVFQLGEIDYESIEVFISRGCEGSTL